MILPVKKFLRLITKVSLIVVANNFLCLCSSINEAANSSTQPVYLYRDSTLVNDSLGKNWNGAIKKSNAHSGTNVAFVDSSAPYGLSFKTNIQPSFFCKNSKLIIEAWISVDDIENAGSIAIQVKQKDSSLYWNTLDLKQKIKQKNTWTFVTDTFIIARSLMADYKNEIFTFLWNNTGKGKIMGDDFYIKIIENEMPIYTPNLTLIENTDFSEVLFKGNFYSIVYNKEKKIVFLADKNNLPLTSAFTYYEDIELDNKKNEEISSAQFTAKQKNDSCIILTTTTQTTDLLVEINCNKNSPKLGINATMKPKRNIKINRQSLIFAYKDALREVYRKNTQIDTANFQIEYWLNKEGCKIGEDDRSIIFYRNNLISSTQLNTQKKMLVFNFDFANDHLLMQFPVRDDTKKGIKKDVSKNTSKVGEEQNYQMNLYIGSSVSTIPVFMQQPHAYLSTFILTEHADYTDLHTNYAVYFGSSNITSSTKASGGFCKYKIPVTKSIFYHDPDKTNNKSFNGAFSSEMCCWKGNEKYQEFINDIYAQGIEIAFHTPENKTSKKEYMEEALSVLSKKYKAKTWIDHGYDNGRDNNREDLVCDGLLPNAANYSMDLWEKYQVKYFWNCYNEDSAIYGVRNFSNKLKNPYIGYGDQFPSPIYWKNKINQSEIISWTAHFLMDYKDENLWDYYFDTGSLYDVTQTREIAIGHMYPARVDSITTYYNKTADGKFIINSKFDSFLARLAKFNERKNIYLTSIDDYLDYSLALEKIEMAIDSKGIIQLKNNQLKEIKGFTLYSLKQIKINNVVNKVQLKTGGYLYSFDFKAGQTILVN